MENFYLKINSDWENKTKYGYVEGENKNMVNRLKDSSEEHSELSEFTNILSFKKTDKYRLHYKEFDKIISLIVSDIKKIELVEKIYDLKLPLFKKLNKYFVVSLTNKFIYNEGIHFLLRVLKEEFPLLGLKLVKEYTKEEIEEINNSSREIFKKKIDSDYQILLKLLQAR